jgi:hypothetical protein
MVDVDGMGDSDGILEGEGDCEGILEGECVNASST